MGLTYRWTSKYRSAPLARQVGDLDFTEQQVGTEQRSPSVPALISSCTALRAVSYTASTMGTKASMSRHCFRVKAVAPTRSRPRTAYGAER